MDFEEVVLYEFNNISTIILIFKESFQRDKDISKEFCFILDNLLKTQKSLIISQVYKKLWETILEIWPVEVLDILLVRNSNLFIWNNDFLIELLAQLFEKTHFVII